MFFFRAEKKNLMSLMSVDTVDGFRNPKHSPVDMVNITLVSGVYTSQVVSRISEPSTVVV